MRRPEFPHCQSCQVVWYSERTFFASIVAKGSSWYSQLVRYKSLPVSMSALDAVAAALSGGCAEHESAIATTLGGKPTVISSVPSTRIATTFDTQPLGAVIRRVAYLKPLAAPALRRTPGVTRQRRLLQPEVFECVSDLRGQRVLLIEDLSASLTTIQPALTVLQQAGASCATMVIAREVTIAATLYDASSILPQLGRPAWWSYED
jgi:hypothetical protein